MHVHNCMHEKTANGNSSVTCCFEQDLTWSKESDNECAGSVETTNVVCPAAANLTARDAARLVLPTPPFPLIMMYLRFVPAAIASNELSVLCTVC